jgi:hypothetical protein
VGIPVGVNDGCVDGLTVGEKDGSIEGNRRYDAGYYSWIC